MYRRYSALHYIWRSRLLCDTQSLWTVRKLLVEGRWTTAVRVYWRKIQCMQRSRTTRRKRATAAAQVVPRFFDRIFKTSITSYIMDDGKKNIWVRSFDSGWHGQCTRDMVFNRVETQIKSVIDSVVCRWTRASFCTHNIVCVSYIIITTC